ncbi:MAG: hypothetical protein HYV93_21425 [Candidatus Rokubacteria bacterium]|nr:hypothetical protein [Candidatus Rokubacteria bacterium]
MRILALAVVTAFALASAMPALGADDSKVKAATERVEGGAKKIGKGEVVSGVEETAKGIGSTVVEGAKFSGEKVKEAAQAAEPPAKNAWERTKDGAVSFGQSVKNFFTRLFSN